MKFFKVLLSLSLFLLLFYFKVSAQSDTSVLNHILTKTAKLYNNIPVEKVYIHFDKPYYALGDTVWFKAYLTIDHHQLSGLSRIMYMDLLNSRDSTMTSLKLQIKNGVGWGSIPISQYTFRKGNYRVVAYTNWMNNSDLSYFFNKNITIGDAVNSSVSTQISLKTAMANKAPKITAGIYYKDDDGNPLIGKKVSWSIQKDDDAIAKGKGETDKNGFITISFLNTKNVGLDSANMVTVIENAPRKQVTSVFSLKSVAKPNDIQFFAEGGQLLNGVKTKIAFKAVNPTGLGIDVKGTITDNNNQVVADFTSTHLGMGAFMFTPEDGKNYTAKVTFADGSTAIPDLPKIETGAIGLSLNNTDPNVLKLKMQTDQPFLKAYLGKTFYILAKCNGVICYAAKTHLQNLIYEAPIAKTKFPTGIVQVTLFSEDGDPISERIAFIQHNDQLNLVVSSDHPAYATRQKVKLNILAKNGDQPAEGSFSLSVIDDSKVPYNEDAETTILTNLLLTSDIRGYIEKPNYYFIHPDEKTAADLDVLMQTQGYRRFSYDGIMNDKYPQITQLPETGMSISGTLRAANGIPVKNGNVKLLIADKNFSVNTVSDVDGRFRFSNLVFADSAKVNISARNNARAADLVLTIDNDAGQRVPTNPNKPDEILNIDSTLSAYLKNSKLQFKNSNTLKEVVIKDTRIVKTVSHRDYSSLASLSALADQTIPGALLKNCGTAFECITALARGMTYDNGAFYVTRDYATGSRTPAAIFLRGQPVDVNALVSLRVDDVESVEVFTKDELGLINSAYSTNGVLVVNMKKPPEATKVSLQDLKNLLPQPNDITITPKGYATVRTFYLPRYSGPKETQPAKADTRSTIYWNPNIITDKTGAASLEYFNSDGTGTYRVIIEGIDKDGNLGRQLFRYTVK